MGTRHVSWQRSLGRALVLGAGLLVLSGCNYVMDGSWECCPQYYPYTLHPNFAATGQPWCMPTCDDLLGLDEAPVPPPMVPCNNY